MASTVRVHFATIPSKICQNSDGVRCFVVNLVGFSSFYIFRIFFLKCGNFRGACLAGFASSPLKGCGMAVSLVDCTWLLSLEARL